MATTKMDITLAARTARHLYMTTAIFCYFLILLGLGFTVFSMDYFTEDRLGLMLSIAFLALFAGCIFALYQARRELNGWAYITVGFCTVTLLVILSVMIVVLLFIGPQGQTRGTNAVGAHLVLVSPSFFVAIYLVRVLIDFRRLALSRYDTLNETPLELANAVSGLLRNTCSPVPSIHRPTDPIRTAIYVSLFGLLALVMTSRLIKPIPFVGDQPYLLDILLISLADMARRHYVLRANVLLELDTRLPIIFLRSFGDDKVQLWGKGILRKFRKRTIDEAIAPLSGRLGPFVAIANPNTKLPRLGAAQSYYSNDTWQSAITRWIGMAQLIVMVAGRTEGIRWELDHIFSNQAHRKLMVFFSPAARANPSTITRWLEDHFLQTRYRADLRAIDPAKAIAIVFGDDGLFIIESSRIRSHEVDYLVAFQAVIFAMIRFGSRTAHVSGTYVEK